MFSALLYQSRCLPAAADLVDGFKRNPFQMDIPPLIRHSLEMPSVKDGIM